MLTSQKHIDLPHLMPRLLTTGSETVVATPESLETTEALMAVRRLMDPIDCGRKQAAKKEYPPCGRTRLRSHSYRLFSGGVPPATP